MDKFNDVEDDSLMYFVTSKNPSWDNVEMDNGTLKHHDLYHDKRC
jgi:hypothetical protein